MKPYFYISVHILGTTEIIKLESVCDYILHTGNKVKLLLPIGTQHKLTVSYIDINHHWNRINIEFEETIRLTKQQVDKAVSEGWEIKK